MLPEITFLGDFLSVVQIDLLTTKLVSINAFFYKSKLS